MGAKGRAGLSQAEIQALIDGSNLKLTAFYTPQAIITFADAGVTWYDKLLGVMARNTTESAVQQKLGGSGKIKKIILNVLTNSTTAISQVRIRKNGVSQAELQIDINAGMTGKFVSTGEIIFNESDLLNLSFSDPVGSGSITSNSPVIELEYD